MTLTQTAIIVKQAITFSTIVLVLGIFSFIGYKIWYAYYLANLPVVEEKPDNKFGPLPEITFPKTPVSTSNFTYSLDTVTGGLPKVGVDPGFEKIIKVYFINQAFATLLSTEKSQNLAEKFGIKSPPEILSDTKYKFTSLDKTLNVDLDSGNFSYTNESTVSAQPNLDEDNNLVSGFKQTLATLEVLKEDLGQGRSKVTLFRLSDNELILTKIRQEASLAQVSLWPASLNNKQIFSADFDKSLVNAIVSKNSNNMDNYLSLDFIYFPIDTSTFATYYTKTAESAFDDLKNGKGVVIVEPEKPQVSISSVYLGYYLPEDYSPYLQPIFIFEGPGFVAYVNATQNLNSSSQ